MVDPYGSIPAYRQVTESIRSRISAGRLGPGAILPSAKDIAAEMEIGVATVRRAMRDLANDGVIELVRGRLAVVREQPPYVRHALPRKATVRARMPNPAERSQLRIQRGVPLLLVIAEDGTETVYVGDRDELTT